MVHVNCPAIIQGKYEEAEPLSRSAIAITENTIGKDNPGYAKQLGGLAALLEKQVRGATCYSTYCCVDRRYASVRTRMEFSRHGPYEELRSLKNMSCIGF